MRSSSSPRWLVILLAALVASVAHSAAAQQAQDAPTYPQDELDQLLAPIALYPDDLLTQILVASTYPLEVVEAARFVQANPNMNGPALDDTVSQRNWDPSVQSLTAFPQVLAMMNDKLEWTERLGNAFLADERRVMDTVQSLRRRAETNGNLAPSPQQTIVDRDNVIVIEPAQPEVVYVPVYDPLTIYGAWWAPGYLPWFWYPAPIYGYPVVFTGIAFGIGWAIGLNHWGWCRPDWHGHHVVLNTGHNRFWDRPDRPPPQPGRAWQHSPYHRRGVPYANAQTQQRFQPMNPDAIRQRQSYRGYAPARAQPGTRVAPSPTPSGRPPASVPAAPPAPAAPQQAQGPRPVPRPTAQPPVIREAPVAPPIGVQRSSPSAFDPGMSRSQAQINAQRGTHSLGSMPAPAPPAIHAPAMHAPSAPARPMPAPRGR